MIVENLSEVSLDNLFLKITKSSYKIFLKIEGMNVAGSIKIKAAVRFLNVLEKEGRIHQGSVVIESSSGNLGIALAILCAERGYKFVCVADSNTNESTESLIKAYGAKIVRITKKDSNGGYLGNRIKYIDSFLRKETDAVWPNQYNSLENIKAHYLKTASEIYNNFQNIDYVFIGSGTTGTLGGVSSYFKKYSSQTKIIAVEPEGSITFGGKPKTRKVPGIGTSRVPEISQYSSFTEVIYVSEKDCVSTCIKYALDGRLLGGSTGSVLSAIERYKDNFKKGDVIVAISPDLGERYLNTVYNTQWVNENVDHNYLQYQKGALG